MRLVHLAMSHFGEKIELNHPVIRHYIISYYYYHYKKLDILT